MNKVFYGEYTLAHWVELMLTQNIVLPEYQRYFVWDESEVKGLMDSIKDNLYVPAITIGAFKNDNKVSNLIIDGQQRLTSILLAYLGIYPDKSHFKSVMENYADENDGDDDLIEEFRQSSLEWTFKQLTNKGKTKEEILKGTKFYKSVDYNLPKDFFHKHLLAFTYLVPKDSSLKDHQKYFSQVFRSINIKGVNLTAQESREALYFLDNNLKDFFKPSFMDTVKITAAARETKLDFVRMMAYLSQYHLDGSSVKVARGYKQMIEEYFESYINAAVEDKATNCFVQFSSVFPNKQYRDRFERLESSCINLNLLDRKYGSIIETDLDFFGLLYHVLYLNKAINLDNQIMFQRRRDFYMSKIKKDVHHKRSPGALKYIRERIDTSIKIYKLLFQ